MKFRYKIILGYLSIALLSGLICLIGINRVGNIRHSYDKVTNQTVPVIQILEELKLAGVTIVSATGEYLYLLTEHEHHRATESPQEKQDNDLALAHEREELNEQGYLRMVRVLEGYGRAIDENFQDEKEYLSQISAAANELISISQEIIRLKESGIFGGAMLLQRERMEEAEDDFLGIIDATIEKEREELSERNAHVESTIVTSYYALYSATGFTFLLSILGGFLLANAFASPIEKLKQAATTIARGDFSFHLGLPAKDEIGDLGREFTLMARSLLKSRQDLQCLSDYSDNIIDTMSEALVILSSDGIIRRGNLALYDLLGYSAEELIGSSIREILQDDRLIKNETLIWLESSDSNLVAESCLLSKAAEPIHVHLLGSWVRDPQEDKGQLVLLIQDQREIKAAYESLDKGRKFLETILDSMSDEISILDADKMTIVRTNQAFRDTYGDDTNLLGKTCHKITHERDTPCDGPHYICPVEDVAKSGASLSCEHVHFTPDNQKIFCEIHVTPIFDSGNRIRHYLHISRDITKRKQSENQLRDFARRLEEQNRELEQAHRELKESQGRILQQDKMASIGQLAAGVAHEINNPMGFIISNLGTLDKYLKKLIEFDQSQAALLKKEQREVSRTRRKELRIDYLIEDIPDLISESLDGAQRVKKIVQDLKGFSRLDQPEFIPININECIESTLNIVWNEIKYNSKIERDFRLEELVPCYAQQLTQVFINLLVNASHAMESSGTIRIETYRSEEMATIRLTDTGKGMDKETQTKIFEPFFTTKEVGKGTGLGLSIVYDIIKNHRGDIQVESTPGKGTTFLIQLPLKPEPQGNPQKQTELTT